MLIPDSEATSGANRCFHGSTFPIAKLWTDYSTLYRIFRDAIGHLSEGEQAAILHDTASRVYRI